VGLRSKILLAATGLLLAILAVAAAVASARSDPAPDKEDALPDLRTLPLADLRVEEDEDEKILRFSNTVWNAGDGPLEVRGEPSASGETLVTQAVHLEDGGTEEREVGKFVHHDDHDHWHVEDFALYELRSIRPGGEVGSVVASSGKVSFCIIENTEVDGHLVSEHREKWEYGGCGDETQGISPGWGDTYGASVSGQKLSIEAVPDGRYALRSVADPENRFAESDPDNNGAIVYLQIDGDEVEEIDEK
jgi:hypothetical protein